MTVINGVSSKYRQTGSLCIYYRCSTGIISKKCMNEDSVALIIREKCVYRIRILKKEDLELLANILLKDTSC